MDEKLLYILLPVIGVIIILVFISRIKRYRYHLQIDQKVLSHYQNEEKKLLNAAKSKNKR